MGFFCFPSGQHVSFVVWRMAFVMSSAPDAISHSFTTPSFGLRVNHVVQRRRCPVAKTILHPFLNTFRVLPRACASVLAARGNEFAIAAEANNADRTCGDKKAEVSEDRGPPSTPQTARSFPTFVGAELLGWLRARNLLAILVELWLFWLLHSELFRKFEDLVQVIRMRLFNSRDFLGSETSQSRSMAWVWAFGGFRV